MTTQPDEEMEPVRVGGGTSSRNTIHDRFPFYLGDDDTVLIGTRPKMAVLIDLVAGMTDDGDPMRQAAVFNEFLSEVLDEDSEAYLRSRLRDREDDLDLDHPDIEAMFKTLVGVWYGARPTGGRRGSSAPSARTGKRSTVRARSGASTP